MAKKLIVANWKMHFNAHQASLLLHKLQTQIETHRDIEVVLCPSFLVLQSLSLQIEHHKFRLGAQNCYWRDEGAYTGEVSATMLRGLVEYVIVGHSERRYVFGERDEEIRHKVQAVVRNGMTPILCVGETAQDRTDNETKHVLHDQITAGLANLTSAEIEKIVVAYEPVWAIGSGKTPTTEDVESAASVIRKQIEVLYGAEAAQKMRVLYGGSVDGHNSADFLNTKGVDGLLVGGASLKADVFGKIVEAATNKKHKK